MNDRPFRVALCGVGRMGAEMVAALTERGFPVTVWNRTARRAITAAERNGAHVASTPAMAAKDADVVFTMLTDGEAVLSTLTGQDGILAGAGEGTVVVDCSTIGARAARAAAHVCTAAGVRFLDCPVSGSTTVAREGRLGLMVGGDPAVVSEVRPVLDALGTVVYVGPAGTGAAAKIAVNALLHTFSTALAECLVTARQAGVSADALFDVLAAGVLWNRFLGYKRPAFTDPANAGVAFDLATATKDLRLAAAAGDGTDLTRSVVRRVLDLHQRALEAGYGDRDMAAMAAWFQAGTDGPDPSPATGNTVPGRESERT